MRKRELIRLLNMVEGDPEIIIWNEWVGDWMGIKNVQSTHLYRLKFRNFVESIRLYYARKESEKTGIYDPEYSLSESESVKSRTFYRRDCQWSDYVDSKNLDKYTRKRVLLLVPKLRGITTWDRSGTVSY